jgi:hypothetical protein
MIADIDPEFSPLKEALNNSIQELSEQEKQKCGHKISYGAFLHFTITCVIVK